MDEQGTMEFITSSLRDQLKVCNSAYISEGVEQIRSNLIIGFRRRYEESNQSTWVYYTLFLLIEWQVKSTKIA